MCSPVLSASVCSSFLKCNYKHLLNLRTRNIGCLIYHNGFRYFVPYIGGCQIVVQAVLIVLDWGVHDVVEVLLLLAEAPLQCALVKKLDILKLSVLVSRALSTVHKDLGRYQGYHYLFSVEQGQQEVESVALVVVGGAVEFHALNLNSSIRKRKPCLQSSLAWWFLQGRLPHRGHQRAV